MNHLECHATTVMQCSTMHRSRNARSVRGSVGVLAVLFCACGPSPQRVLSVERDSAGVRVVTSLSRAEARFRFQLDSVPVRDWGGMQSNPADEFRGRNGFLRAAMREDGGIVVIDQDVVRTFAPDGHLIVSVGTRGAGPGEFRGLSQVCVSRGDTVVVFDGANMKLAILSPMGEVVREIPHPPGGYLLEHGCLGDGTFVTQTLTGATARVWLDGLRSTSLGTLKATSSIDGVRNGALMTVRNSEIYVGGRSKPEWQVLDTIGRVRTVIRFDEAPVVLTEAEARQSAGYDAPRGALVATQPGNDTRMRPFYDGLLVAPNGMQWLRAPRQDPADYGAPEVWTGFGRNGVLLGSLSIPAASYDREAPPNSDGKTPKPKLRPVVMEFTSTGVLLLRFDDDGAPHFSLYPFHQLPK